MEMEMSQARQRLTKVLAEACNGRLALVLTIVPHTYKVDGDIPLRRGLILAKRPQVVIRPVAVNRPLDIIDLVHGAVPQALPGLLCFRPAEDIGQRVAKVHCPGFLCLCGAEGAGLARTAIA